MPGPKSEPRARDRSGRVISGKTNLARAGLKSGQGMSKIETDQIARENKDA